MQYTQICQWSWLRANSSICARFFSLVKLQGAIIKSSHLTGFFLLFQPRGSGILEFGSEAEAKQAVEKMDGYNYKGRNLHVHGFRFNRFNSDFLKKQKNATPRFDADRDELRRSPPSDYRYICWFLFHFTYNTSDVFWAFFTYVTTLIRYFTTLAYFLKSDAAWPTKKSDVICECSLTVPPLRVFRLLMMVKFDVWDKAYFWNKGHLISEWLLDVLILPKKTTQKSDEFLP